MSKAFEYTRKYRKFQKMMKQKTKTQLPEKLCETFI